MTSYYITQKTASGDYLICESSYAVAPAYGRYATPKEAIMAMVKVRAAENNNYLDTIGSYMRALQNNNEIIGLIREALTDYDSTRKGKGHATANRGQ